jgi:hypothetical protein
LGGGETKREEGMDRDGGEKMGGDEKGCGGMGR